MSFQTPLDPDTVYYIDSLFSENIKGLKNNVKYNYVKFTVKTRNLGPRIS